MLIKRDPDGANRFPRLRRQSSGRAHKGNSGLLYLQEYQGGIFDARLDVFKKRHGFAAVYDPVIVGECDIHHGSDHHLAVMSHGAVLSRMEPEYAALWGIHDRGRKQ